MGKGVAKREDKAWKKVQKAEKRKAALGKVHADDKTTQSKSSEGHAKVAKATGDQRYMNKVRNTCVCGGRYYLLFILTRHRCVPSS